MPTISIFTPSHDPTYLDQCWESLLAQTFTDFEWIVILNDHAQWTKPKDPRVRRLTRNKLTGQVGALKHAACSLATGDILVELDHDDILLPSALEDILSAFDSNPSTGFVYSNCAQINADSTPNHDEFASGNGWSYYPCARANADGTYFSLPPYHALHAKPPTPHNLSYIWWAPNHVRAFRRSLYTKVGGYDPTLTICDDQDLMCRLYQVTGFHHIDKLLYLQRIHDNNTQLNPEKNAAIQLKTVELYDQYIQPNALAWSTRNNLLALDLGGAHNCPESYVPIDIAISGNDILTDLASIESNTVGVVRAVDFLEHIPDSITLLNEIHRILAPNGILLSLTPSTDGRGAFCDPTHVSFFNELSFRYYTDHEYRKYVPAIVTPQFAISRLVTYFPSQWHETNNVPYVCANLVKEPI